MQNTDDILAAIDAVTGPAQPATPAVYVTPEGDTVTSEAVAEAALGEPELDVPDTAEAAQWRYDPVLGRIPADLDEAAAQQWVADQAAQAEAEPVADEPTAEELADELTEVALASEEGQQGTAGWEAELQRRERERRARVEALDRAAEVRSYVSSYLVLPPAQRDVILDTLTLWTLASYAVRASGVTPYLYIVAATQGAGKSRVLEVLNTLAHNPSKIEVNPTAPVVRLLASEGRTLFLDEIDQLAKDASFVAVCNSGYRAGGSITRVGRTKGGQFADSSSTFCAKVMAGIAREGSLPLPSATLDRGITIRIVRATSDEMRQTRRFRMDLMRDESEVVAMRDWMQTWSHVNYRALKDTWVEVPELSTSRAMEIWEPLFGVAEQLGGDWPERVRAAALALDGEREQAVDPNAALVADIKVVITEWLAQNPGRKNMPVEELVSARNNLDAPQLTEKLNPITFGKRLGAFGIKSMPSNKVRVYQVRGDDGELRPQWADLFARF